MYLEERVEQLEALSVDQGRQIETIAKGLAELKVTVNQRFDRVNERFDHVDQRFEHVDERFDQVDERFSQVNERFDQVNGDIAELKSGQVRLEATVSDIQQTQQLILTILQERLK